MARSLSQTLSLSRHLPPISSTPSPFLFIRVQSNHSSRNTNLSELSDSADPIVQKLEDAIYRIIVRRSAPDWLPFLPGASYWVPPPRCRSFGIAQLVEKLANPLTDEKSMSTRNSRGWPSSAYYVNADKPLGLRKSCKEKHWTKMMAANERSCRDFMHRTGQRMLWQKNNTPK